MGGVLVSAANFLSAAAEDPQLYWQEHCRRDSGHNATYNDTTMISRIQYDWIDASSTSGNNATTTPTLSELLSASEVSVSSSTDPTCLPYTNQDWDVFVYFLVGSVVLLGCVIGFGILERTTTAAAAAHHPPPSQRPEHYESVESEVEERVASTETDFFRDEPPFVTNDGLELSQPHEHHHNGITATESAVTAERATSATAVETTEGLGHQSYHGDDTSVVQGSGGLLSTLPSNTSRDGVPRVTLSMSFEEGPSPESVLRAVKGPAFCIFFTFFVTLSLFPSWTSHLRSIHQCDDSSSHAAVSDMARRLQNDLYTPFTFLLFNVGDLGGRLLAGKLPVSRILRNHTFSATLVMAACARCLFFPLLLLCIGGGDGNDLSHNVEDGQDARLRIQSLLALSNGFLISLAFMHAPTLIPATAASQEKSSEILTFALSFGLLSGSLFSFPVTKMAMEL